MYVCMCVVVSMFLYFYVFLVKLVVIVLYFLGFFSKLLYLGCIKRNCLFKINGS